MKIALIGLPQAGKRTLFSLLTGRSVPESRKPGQSVEGIAAIRDPRVDVLARIEQPERKVYAENLFALCPDAVEGAGSREWLDAARRCDLLCLVVRAFASDQVYHPKGSVDAERDLAFLQGELLLADMETVEKRLTRIGKERRAGLTPEQAMEEKSLHRCMEVLEGGRPLTQAALDHQERASIRSLELVSLLPTVCAINVSEDALVRDPGAGRLAVSAQIEREIMAIESDTERQEYLASLGLSSSGLDRVNQAAYDALGLMSFYTIGKDEVRAWTIRKGALAPEAAGKIHTDIERGFIRVEVIKYDDLVVAGSEKAAKERGKVQVRGRDYAIQDGDICHYLFNV